jgi:hypothetical protein
VGFEFLGLKFGILIQSRSGLNFCTLVFSFFFFFPRGFERKEYSVGDQFSGLDLEHG